jgi:hypothetical protein
MNDLMLSVGATALRITTLSIMTFLHHCKNAPFRLNGTRQNNTQHLVSFCRMSCFVMLSVTRLSVTRLSDVRQSAVKLIVIRLRTVGLSVIRLSVVRLSVIWLSIVRLYIVKA